MNHLLPMRPANASGSQFTTTDPSRVIAFLQSESFTITRDEPGLVELAREREYVRIDAAGLVTPFGDEARRASYRLLMNCEEI